MSTTTTAIDLTETQLRAWRGLLVTHATLVRALDAQLTQEHDLPLSSYEVLLFVGGSPEGKMRMCDIAERVLLSRSGLTRLVDRLVRHGLLVREAVPDDARGSFAVLTEAGRDLLERSRATHLAGVRELFLDRLSEVEQQQLGAIFDRVLAGPDLDVQERCPGE